MPSLFYELIHTDRMMSRYWVEVFVKEIDKNVPGVDFISIKITSISINPILFFIKNSML